MNLLRPPAFLLPWLLGAATLPGYDVPGFIPDQVLAYKQTTDSSGGAVTLNLDVFLPEGHQATDSRPAVVFFFGGGWSSGSPTQFHPHCEYLASRGMVALSADYRVSSRHGTSPQECVKDGKSAVRWIRANAASLGIDPDRIAAGGGSAGGHVAAATGTLSAYEEPGEDLNISSRPDALILFNPVYDNGPGGYGHSRVQAYWEDFSPLHNISSTTPPATVFLGTNDALIPVATAENFRSLMEAAGVRSDLHLYQDEPHGFFNYEVPDDGSGPWYGYQATVFRMDEFLVSLGWLADPHGAPQPATGWATIFGDAGFAAGSETTSSPLTTDADGDGIAANVAPLVLADGEFVRVTGTVTFDAPLTGSNFRVGLFDGDDPVTAGDGTGYAGLWSEAPATADTNIALGDGTGASHPFETATATVLGPVPAADSTVPAGTPVAFDLMIARNGNALDITTSFRDGASYRPEQNLLNQPVTAFGVNSVAFLMTGNLNATSGSFNSVEVTSGTALPVPGPGGGPGDGISRLITYVDAVEGPAGNTRVSGGSAADTSWLIDPGTSAADEDQWSKRSFGNGGALFQALHSLPDEMPELTTSITGLADGTYEIWAFYWDQVDSDTQNWTLSAGLGNGALTSYSSPGEPAVAGATTTNVSNAADLSFTSPVTVVEGGGLRNLFGVLLGEVDVTGGNPVDVRVDNLLGNGSANRTWFDGVGHAPVNTFAVWVAGFELGGLTGFTDDADGDGLENGLENFLGGDPSVPDARGLAPLEVTTGPGGTFTFTHPQSATPAEDLAASYQWSTSLDIFHEDGATDGGGTTVTFATQPDTPAPGTTTVTATISGPAVPDALFIRLSVTRTTPGT